MRHPIKYNLPKLHQVDLELGKFKPYVYFPTWIILIWNKYKSNRKLKKSIREFKGQSFLSMKYIENFKLNKQMNVMWMDGTQLQMHKKV